MKYCPKCKTEKEENEFYYQKNGKDELSYYCKECFKKITKGWYYKNKNTKTYKTNKSEREKKYYYKYQKRVIARRKLFLFIKRGLMKKLPCIICGDIKSEAHHESYNKPLEVIWLCRKHHTELHIKKRSLNWLLYLPKR